MVFTHLGLICCCRTSRLLKNTTYILGNSQKVFFCVASQLPGCILQDCVCFFPSRSSLLLLTRHLPTGLHEDHLAWPCCWEPPSRCVNWFAVPSQQYWCYCRTFHVVMSLPHGWVIMEIDWASVSSSGCCWKLLAQVSWELRHPHPKAWPAEKGSSVCWSFLCSLHSSQTKKMVCSELNGEMLLFLLLKILGS